MGIGSGRILNDIPHIERFLVNTLQLKTKIHESAKLIVSAEMQQTNIVGKSTLTSNAYRMGNYSTDESRVELRSAIYAELISQKRPENDDDIKMGFGGALPRTDLKREKQAFYIIGLPASGKSGVSASLSDNYGAIILDSDFAKRKFPEYEMDFGASVVHEESSIVIFGGKNEYADESSVLSYAVQNGYNIVIPKIGNDADKIVEFVRALKDKKYDVHLILVRLDRKYATRRALERFINTNRYVPLSHIYDEYSNNPTIAFYDLNAFNHKLFKSFTMISSEVRPSKVLFHTKHSPKIDL